MNSASEILLTIAGVAILILVFYDIHATVLKATKQSGPFSTLLNRGLWWIATRATRTLSRRRRHRILSMVGPLLMPTLVALLILMLLTGFALAFARALGEYGSVVFISGNMPMKTEISSLLIITKLEQYDIAGATAIAIVMLMVSFLILLSINGLQWWVSRGQRKSV